MNCHYCETCRRSELESDCHLYRMSRLDAEREVWVCEECLEEAGAELKAFIVWVGLTIFFLAILIIFWP